MFGSMDQYHKQDILKKHFNLLDQIAATTQGSNPSLSKV